MHAGSWNFKKATAAHELGHVFGLAENNSNPYSIMCQNASGRKVSVPMYVDLIQVRNMY